MIFAGFPPEGMAFLAELAANNRRDWFAEHRQSYEYLLLEPAQGFVMDLGERLKALAPALRVDPRIDGRGTLMRLARDTRFSADKTPYKTELSGLFWEGEGNKTSAPAFGFRLRADGMDLMAGLFAFAPQALAIYRAAVSEEVLGQALATIVVALRTRDGYAIGGEQSRRVPAGYPPEHPRAELLCYKGLYAYPAPLQAAVVCSTALIDVCMSHFQVLAPLQRWLVEALDAVVPGDKT